MRLSRLQGKGYLGGMSPVGKFLRVFKPLNKETSIPDLNSSFVKIVKRPIKKQYFCTYSWLTSTNYFALKILEIYREIADQNAPSEAIYLHCVCGNGNRPIRLDQIFLLVDF